MTFKEYLEEAESIIADRESWLDSYEEIRKIVGQNQGYQKELKAKSPEDIILPENDLTVQEARDQLAFHETQLSEILKIAEKRFKKRPHSVPDSPRLRH